MKTTFRSSFLRDVKAIRDKHLSARLKTVIEQVEEAESLASIINVKQLRREKDHIEFESVNIVWRWLFKTRP